MEEKTNQYEVSVSRRSYLLNHQLSLNTRGYRDRFLKLMSKKKKKTRQLPFFILFKLKNDKTVHSSSLKNVRSTTEMFKNNASS